MSARGVLRICEGGLLQFWCPGCKTAHGVNAGWTFDGNYEKPTFSPSVLTMSGHHTSRFKSGDSCWCTYNAEHPPEEQTRFRCERCHLFVTSGNLVFLSDCSHDLAGKTVVLEPF